MGRRIDISGQIFGRLTTINIERINGKIVYWLCKCECGNMKIVSRGNLKSGNVKSCGCLRNEAIGNRNRVHGLAKTRIHNIWLSMKQRCINNNCPAYKNYGGRGIKICERWLSFNNFLEDMLDGYSQILTLERQNVNGDYNKANCIWASMKDQQRNRSNNHIIEFNGKRGSVAELSEIYKISSGIVYQRLRYGWSISDALTTPKQLNQYFRLQTKNTTNAN